MKKYFVQNIKVMISYPPLEGKGSPMLTQNRQFQWYHEPSYIYPLIPAYAATLLQKEGYSVIWNDCIAEKRRYGDFIKFFKDQKPDLIVFETKTPVVRLHWKIVDELKEIYPSTKVALMGDHVTAFPEESMKHCKTDFVITGGDYDFLLMSIVRFLSKGEKIEKGIWFRDKDEIKSTGPFELNHDLNSLPFIDRELTLAHMYGEKWKKRLPFFYTLAGRDCPWAKCSFCSWTTTFPEFRTRTPENLLDEIGHLIERYNAKEIFDDTGTFPGGEWLRQFCEGMIERGYNKKILFSCNMRFDYIKSDIVRLMKKAGFRKIKAGLESANQKTLDKINKGVTVRQITDGCRIASRAGIDVHLTVMVGYPWETRKDAENTLNLARFLMQKGYAEMLQSTVVVPYPGTPLYETGVKENLFRFAPKDYERFDMTEAVFTTPDMTSEEIMNICGGIYKSFLSPWYILRRMLNIRSFEDIGYIFRGSRAIIGHLKDFFRPRSTCGCKK